MGFFKVMGGGGGGDGRGGVLGIKNIMTMFELRKLESVAG